MKKYILSALLVSAIICGLVSCDQSDDLPPKTENSSTKYLLPKGTVREKIKMIFKKFGQTL